MPRCAHQARKPSLSYRPGLRSGRAGARRSRLPPRPELGGCRGAVRPSRADAGDGPADPPGCGSGCRSRPGCGPVRAPLLCSWARPPRSRARARSCCPVARRTDPAWLAGRSAGAARPKPPNGHRLSSTFRTRTATRAKVPPSVPSIAMLPQKDGNARLCLRVGRNRYPAKNGYGATGYRSSGYESSGAILGQTRKGQDWPGG